MNCGGKGGACGDVGSTFRQPPSVIWLALAKAIDNGASLVSRASLAVWFPQATWGTRSNFLLMGRRTTADRERN